MEDVGARRDEQIIIVTSHNAFNGEGQVERGDLSKRDRVANADAVCGSAGSCIQTRAGDSGANKRDASGTGRRVGELCASGVKDKERIARRDVKAAKAVLISISHSSKPLLLR